ncbi:uncharacterized protein BKA78DRAFT_302238 [Phyllosticta capitalensis]|uniref:uncharacterized protein n=1 Tax=Phyllosticta capitalensis TaxID=121624 RepID=UPI003131AEF5
MDSHLASAVPQADERLAERIGLSCTAAAPCLHQTSGTLDSSSPSSPSLQTAFDGCCHGRPTSPHARSRRTTTRTHAANAGAHTIPGTYRDLPFHRRDPRPTQASAPHARLPGWLAPYRYRTHGSPVSTSFHHHDSRWCVLGTTHGRQAS